MADTTRLHRRRDRLYAENPICPFCGVYMVLPKDLPNYSPQMKRVPDCLCTIEHLNSKLNPRRRKPNKEHETRIIICCYKCNHNRAIADEIKYLDTAHRRNGNRRKRTNN